MNYIVSQNRNADYGTFNYFSIIPDEWDDGARAGVFGSNTVKLDRFDSLEDVSKYWGMTPESVEYPDELMWVETEYDVDTRQVRGIHITPAYRPPVTDETTKVIDGRFVSLIDIDIDAFNAITVAEPMLCKDIDILLIPSTPPREYP